MTSTATTVKAILSEWTDSRGHVRRYCSNVAEIIGLEVDRYKTGNIATATVNGVGISNSAAGRLLAVKVWLDSDNQVHVDRWADGPERYVITKDALAEAVRNATKL